MKHVSRSLCDSNLQGTNKRNDKESRWESFLVCSTNFSSFFHFSQFSERLQQTDITSSSSTEHDARTVFIRLSEKNVLFFQAYNRHCLAYKVFRAFKVSEALEAQTWLQGNNFFQFLLFCQRRSFVTDPRRLITTMKDTQPFKPNLRF